MTPSFDAFFEAVTRMTGDPKTDQKRLQRLQRGEHAEQMFLSIAERLGIKNIRRATKFEEVQEHIDFIITNKSNKISFDVKAQLQPNADYILEIIGDTGYPGSVFRKATYLAFQNIANSSFYIVNRQKLQDIVEKRGGILVDRWGNLTKSDMRIVDKLEEANIANATFYYYKLKGGSTGKRLVTTITMAQIAQIADSVMKLPIAGITNPP